MKILLLNQFYVPDTAATAQLLADVAVGLVAAGHEVHVLASRRCYGGGAEEYPAESICPAGVHVHRVAATGFGRAGFIGRAIDYASFYVRAMRRARRLPRMDVCIALTTPPFIAAVAARLKKRCGTKLVLWSMDVYPELAVALGVLRAGGIMHGILSRVAQHIYRKADVVICLGERMRSALLQAGVEDGKLVVVHNWVPGEAVAHAAPVGSPATLLYSGNLGMGHELETAVRGIAAVGNRADFQAWFVGHGKLRRRLEELVVELNLQDRVEFRPPCKLSELSALLATGDIHLVSQRPGTQGLLVPSKIYGILAAGRPAVYIGPPDTEVAAILEDAQAGVVVPPGDVSATATAIRTLLDDASRRRAMGERAAAYYASKFGRDRGVRRIVDIVNAAHLPCGDAPCS